MTKRTSVMLVLLAAPVASRAVNTFGAEKAAKAVE